VIAAITFAILTICAVPAALGAVTTEGSLAEYKETVEPICSANAQKNEKILSGVRTDVREGNLKHAAVQFGKAATALQSTFRELNAVPQPSANATRLTKWLTYVKTEVALLRKVAAELRKGQANRARAVAAKLTHNANLANSQIAIFDLRSCIFKPTQYV
jgi:hypothetical protein